MDLSNAYKLFKTFIMEELNGRETRDGWFRIDGSRICNRCTKTKISKLYCFCEYGTPIFLNCFRASCGMRRRINETDFKDFGFTNAEAVSLLLTASNRGIRKMVTSGNNELIIRDLILSDEQKAYMYKRTKLDMNMDLVRKYRIIPNLHQVTLDNFHTGDPFLLKIDNTLGKLNKGDYITFATNDYNTFSVRGNRTKLILSIMQKKFGGYELIQGNKVETICITESIFDIINIMNTNQSLDNTSFIATLGFGNMLSLIVSYYTKYIDTVENLIIFADSDEQISNNKYTYKKTMYDNLIKGIYNKLGEDVFKSMCIVYNQSAKDFGNLSDNIKPKKIIIK